MVTFKNGLTEDNEKFQTPKWLCDKIAKAIDLPNDSTILEPTPGAGNLVKALTKFKVSTPVSDFWDLDDPIHKEKFDAVVMNPPFSDAECILMKCMQLSDMVVAIVPWITILSSDKRTSKIREWGIEKVWHLPRKVFSGISSSLMVIFLKKGYKGDILLEFVDYEEEIKPSKKKRPVW